MPLRKRKPDLEAARRTVREAFEDLEKAISPSDAQSCAGITLENVQKAALDLENQLGMRSSLRNMRRLMPLFAGLEHYAQVIDVLCNGTPYLPWLWAPIKLILVVSQLSAKVVKVSVAYSLTIRELLVLGIVRLRGRL